MQLLPLEMRGWVTFGGERSEQRSFYLSAGFFGIIEVLYQTEGELVYLGLPVSEFQPKTMQRALLTQQSPQLCHIYMH